MTRASTIPPVVWEAVVKTLDHLIRLGSPFTLKDAEGKSIRELVDRAVPEERRYGKSTDELVNLIFNTAIKRKRFHGKLFRRFDRATGKEERKFGAIVYYPSNDRERFKLKENEVFVDNQYCTGPGSRAKRLEVEPPLIIKTAEPPVRLTDEFSGQKVVLQESGQQPEVVEEYVERIVANTPEELAAAIDAEMPVGEAPELRFNVGEPNEEIRLLSIGIVHELQTIRMAQKLIATALKNIDNIARHINAEALKP